MERLEPKFLKCESREELPHHAVDIDDIAGSAEQFFKKAPRWLSAVIEHEFTFASNVLGRR